MPRLIAVQIGQAQTWGTYGATDPNQKPWTTAFFKQPVAGPVRVDVQGLAGDEQCDRRFHGGPDKAVLAYSAEHYPVWIKELGEPDPGEPEMGPGGFGENLTIAGLSEAEVCIGDQWRVGEVLLQVTQPRQPCWKLGRRWRRPNLPKIVIRTSRCGWYLRVLQAGHVCSGDEVTLLDRPHPEWTIVRANGVYYDRQSSDRQTLASLNELSASWHEELLGTQIQTT